MAASKAATEATWLRRLLDALGAPQRHPTPLCENNNAYLPINSLHVRKLTLQKTDEVSHFWSR